MSMLNTLWQYTKVLVLFTVMFMLLAAVGAALGMFLFGGGWLAMTIIFLIIAGFMNFIAYFFSDWVVLRAYGGRIVSETEAPRLHRIVERVASRAGIPKPRVAIIPEMTPNAFATGRGPNHAVVAVTEGILELLDEDELEAVIGHEISHIKHRDILVMSVAATLAGAISYMANLAMWSAFLGGGRRDEGGSILGLIAVAIFAPIAAMIIQMAVSRSREYYADEGSAEITGNPLALASALHKLEHGTRLYPPSVVKPHHEPLFIVNPFHSGFLVRLFSTHPPTEERIKRLEDIARKMGQL